MTKDDVLKMDPGRELDALVAEKVMGWKYTNCNGEELLMSPESIVMANEFRYTSKPHRHLMVRSYSTDLYTSWEVLERIRRYRMFAWFGVDTCQEGYRVLLRFEQANPEDGDEWFEVNAPNVPEAICKAALLTTLED